jgi:hypothetical protein
MGKGWWSKKAPRVQEIAQICNGFELREACWRWGVFEGIRDNVKAMDDFIFRRGRRDGAVGMAKFHRVRDDLALGVAPHKFEAAVGVKCRPNVESVLGSEVPRAAS